MTNLAAVLLVIAGAAEPSVDHVAYFEQHVRPLLVAECYECHSANSKILQGGLLLDSRAGWQKGGDSGEVILPGKPDESLLIRAVRYDKNEYVHMPPKGKLDEKQIAALVEWVRLGAPDPRTEVAATPAKREINIEEGKKHWAFQPLARSAIPHVKNVAWCRTPVDRFIQAKLEAAGIAANPEADDRTLLRRAYFDLVGLPPTPEEIDAFVQSKSPTKYEDLLDRLLASPHHGERWGRHWLDVARFGESHGFEQDYDRPTAYHYRDFVIDALNRDLPYDVFVKWQLAGDEYAPENPSALQATGFLAAGVHATQITANQAEKERYDELDDMARTVGTTMLGLTIGCARCHDHKYDPITNADYYRIAATFTTTVRSDADVVLNADEHRRAMAEFERRHGPLAAAVKKYERDVLDAKFAEWLQIGKFETPHADWVVLVPDKAQGPEATKFTVAPSGEIRTVGTQFFPSSYTISATTELANVAALRLQAFADASLPGGGPGTGPDGDFVLKNVRITASPLGKPAPGEPASIEVKIARRTTTAEFAQPENAAGAKKPEQRPIVGSAGRDYAAVFEFDKPLPYAEGAKLTVVLGFDRNYQGIGRFQLSVCEPPPTSASLAGTTISETTRRAFTHLAAKADAEKLTKPERAALFTWFCSADERWRELNRAEVAHELRRPISKVAKVLISSEGVPAVRLHTQGPDFYDQTYVLRRGDPNQKVEPAQAGFLQVLLPSADDGSRWQTPPPEGVKTSYRRRALAEWMTDVEHGAGALLARVIVNRLWYYHLGSGIVPTPSDFGVQAGPPSHPELLDYLASELIRGGWRLKPIHKLIMSSAVYRQTTVADAARRRVDVDNRLFWHREWRRLEGEIIRDAMLAVSGTLDETQFGPGTLDPNMRRRSIYFFIKRSKLVPMMSLFDGPDTLQDLAVRSQTTVAPQALLMMNNTTVRDLAGAFARQIAPTSQGDVERAVVDAYRRAIGRSPSDEELRASAAFVRSQTAAYCNEGKPAEAATTAWTDFCQVLFGLNEFVYVE